MTKTDYDPGRMAREQSRTRTHYNSGVREKVLWESTGHNSARGYSEAVKSLLEKSGSESFRLKQLPNGLYINSTPPKGAETLLGVFLTKNARDCFQGDLAEEYETIIIPKFGLTAARRWYYWQVIRSIGQFLRYRIKTRLSASTELTSPRLGDKKVSSEE
jgi:hypothetical protein